MAQGELDYAIDTLTAARKKLELNNDKADDFENFFNSFFESP
jgi:hypothetical protein